MLLKLYSLNYFVNFFRKFIRSIWIIQDTYWKITLLSSNSLLNCLNILHKHMYFRYKILSDIICIDYIEKLKRFEINYNLLSLNYNNRIIISCQGKKEDIFLSVISIYNNANWLEREIWDMYGIFFKNHNDLRRILTDYGFNGYPLRKDFPLNGYIELRYDENYKHIVYEPIEFMQNMRYFKFSNPLLNKKYII